MLQFMNINTDAARQSEERLRAALEKLDEALVGRRFLVEDRFSRADLTACALLRRSCMPDETSVEPPPAVRKIRDELKRCLRGTSPIHQKPGDKPKPKR
jgi:glutathione S-transferase